MTRLTMLKIMLHAFRMDDRVVPTKEEGRLGRVVAVKDVFEEEGVTSVIENE